MSFHVFCMPYRDKMLEALVNQRVMSMEVAHRVADIFAESKEQFDMQIYSKFGSQVAQDTIISLMEKALRDIALKLTTGGGAGYGNSVSFHPGAFQASSGAVSFGSPLDINPINQAISQVNVQQQPTISISPSTDSRLAGGIVQQPPKKEVVKTADNPIGKLMISIHSTGEQGLTMNHKIAVVPEGATKENIDKRIITLLRKVVDVSDPVGENSLIKFDHVMFNTNLGELCFDDGREVISFLDQLLSLEDTIDPYFRVVDYTKLTPIHIPHDEFFNSLHAMSSEVKQVYPRTPVDVMEGRDCLKLIRERLAAKSIIFCREMEDFMLKMTKYIFSKYLRFSDNLNKQVKLNVINALDSLMTSNEKPIKDLREIAGFEKILHEALICIYEFVTIEGRISPIEIDLNYVKNKIPSLDPYIQTRRYMSINNVDCFNTMEYWKYSDQPEVQEQILSLIKKKVLVRFPTSMIITNIFSPVLMRSSLFSGTPNPVLVKKGPELKNVKQEFGPGGEIIALLNQTKIRDDFPDQLFIKVGEDYRKFRLAGTLSDDLIISV